MVFVGGIGLIAGDDGVKVFHLGNEGDSPSILCSIYCVKDDDGNFLLFKGAEGCLAVFDESKV